MANLQSDDIVALFSEMAVKLGVPPALGEKAGEQCFGSMVRTNEKINREADRDRRKCGLDVPKRDKPEAELVKWLNTVDAQTVDTVICNNVRAYVPLYQAAVGLSDVEAVEFESTFDDFDDVQGYMAESQESLPAEAGMPMVGQQMMHIARVESLSFDFVALGATHAEAVKAMVDGLEAHTKKFGLKPGWWGVVDDLNIDECPVGGCLRDHALLIGPCIGVQGPNNVVNEGSYSGFVMSVANGLVTQKINRAGDTVQHDAAKLSEVVKKGDVVDVQYRGGQGVVSGLGKGSGIGR